MKSFSVNLHVFLALKHETVKRKGTAIKGTATVPFLFSPIPIVAHDLRQNDLNSDIIVVV